jgi:hypothetical protein
LENPHKEDKEKAGKKKKKAKKPEPAKLTKEQREFVDTDNDTLIDKAIWVAISNIFKEVEIEYIITLTKKQQKFEKIEAKKA